MQQERNVVDEARGEDLDGDGLAWDLNRVLLIDRVLSEH